MAWHEDMTDGRHLAACRAWLQRAYSQATQYNCVLAWQDLAYDEYKTSDKNVTAMVTMSNYNTDPRYAAFKYGWAAYDCGVAYPYICQIPLENFPCAPPPSPPTPPPSPPVPPSPPAPPSCKPAPTAAKYGRLAGGGTAYYRASTANQSVSHHSHTSC
jgi:hypothetical protein